MSRGLARCAIAFDIDGVFWRSPNVFSFTKSVFERVKEKGVPFVLLTNGGGATEGEKAKKLGQIFDAQLRESQVILAHTPLRQRVEQLKDRLVLVAGNKDVHHVAHHYGLKRVINASEVIGAHPSIYPFSSQHKLSPQHRSLKEITSYHPSDIEAICVLDDGECWGSEIQLIIDCLFRNVCLMFDNFALFAKMVTRNIHIRKKKKKKENSWQKARQCKSSTNIFFQSTSVCPIWKTYSAHDASLCVLIFFNANEHQAQNNSNYAQNTLNEEARKLGYDGVDAKSCYMIGDNPYTDIAGGNNIGWNTILVKTGVYNDTHTFDGNPTFKCQNVDDAVRLVFSKHLS
ncbi:hypothetical protein RFI_14402 [Reticulomyxa filosa]|uniref:Uncharacterized protein n=1 Tax=Reticulomyxa filosa TaxID=46433 RepID=X6N919_RETFI|nr:hypothetical protein RFI_14402 [Reticulomyxa filosa]|eukprot:ETO22790.1 hypothetical protein RFI_14402 [Reticulomyxa filosa]